MQLSRKAANLLIHIKFPYKQTLKEIQEKFSSSTVIKICELREEGKSYKLLEEAPWSGDVEKYLC